MRILTVVPCLLQKIVDYSLYAVMQFYFMSDFTRIQTRAWRVIKQDR